MTALTSYIANKAKLHNLSAWITVFILSIIYVLAHWLTYQMGATAAAFPEKTMEVREVIKMEIKPVRKIERLVREPTKSLTKAAPAPKAKGAAPDPGSIPQLADVSALVQGFDMKNLIARESPATRTPVQRPSTRVITVNSQVNVQEAGLVADGLLEATFDVRPANLVAKRGGGGTPSQGPRIQIGNGNGEGRGRGTGAGAGWGNGTGGGLGGIPGSKGMGMRNTRGTGGGSGDGPRISLGGLGGNGEGGGGISIHALIEWMKKHPGIIPKLVAYDMGHQAGDLSSAVNFTMHGRNFTLYLSCNEHELLLRICLVEGNDYTMLKDNGIKENSNFLLAGDVIRQNGQIQSLISSRQAPGEVANQFYQIFWSWWQSVSK
ncbi:MAG: hypothetical protein ONB44_13050 [candidate division KSB1 bacterium]|nr:hypothetical protein [candidate division KSB1 bacterium]MDZ7303048.1 hypothetical protein [candidate division KSB1 bacterium]MDZ7312444.1 hypothetical protein [candidate division KSB1 bacterium]